MFPICVPVIICLGFRISSILDSGYHLSWISDIVCTEFLTVHSTNQAIYLSLIFLRGRDFSQNVFLCRNPSFNYNPFFPVYEIPYVITDLVVKVHE